MTFRIVLATATAASVLLMASGAMANNGNTLYIVQDGDENVAEVHQSSGGGNNDIGTEADPVDQLGNNNTFRFINSGSGSGNNNDIVKAEQVGDGNYFSVSTWNNADDNVISRFEQLGDENWATVSINGPDDGGVGTGLQEGDKNYLLIEQSGSYNEGNQVLSVSMIGDNNGLPPDGNGSRRRVGTFLYQSGDTNLIQNAYLEGSNNIGPAGNSNTYRNVQRIEQRGTDNGRVLSIASTLGSQNGSLYNRLWVFQDGDRNNFSIHQGETASSFGNHALLTQTGDDNWGTAVQAGDQNLFDVIQTGDGNTVRGSQAGDANAIEVSIVGNLNGSGDFTGLALTKAGATLFSGDIQQSGNNNSASLQISSSDSNQFAFKQTGNLNTIEGTVLGGGSNQSVIIQGGNSNVSVFTQDGTLNAVTVSQ